MAEAGRPAVGRIDVQPHPMPPAGIGHVDQRVEGPDRRRATAGADGHERVAAPPQIAQQFVELLRIHPPPLVQPYAHDLPRAQPQDAGGPRHRVMGVGMDHQQWRRPRSGRPLLPAIGQCDVPRREQGGQVGQGAAVGGQPGECPFLPADAASQFVHHGPFGRGGPGAHVVNCHRLVGDRTDGVHQAGHRQGSGNLVADIPRMVEVVTAIEHGLHEAAELLDEFLAAIRGRFRLPQDLGGQADVFCRMPPGQYFALPRFHRAKVIGQ